MKQEYTKYQQKIIKRYYDNRDAIGVQKLQELVTNLYLAEGKKLETLWKNAQTHMQKLGVPESRIDHLMQQRDPALLAKLVEELFARK